MNALAKRAAQSLYVHRPLLNGEEVVAWAKANGFETTLLADDMHVTLAYSTTPVDWNVLGIDTKPMTVSAGARKIKRFDQGAVVLSFTSAELTRRWREIKDAGAAWDYPDYLPHVTISYNADDIDLSKIEPFDLPLRFGPEVFKTIKTGFTPTEASVKVKALMLARSNGFPVEHIRFSDKLEWTEHNGLLKLSKAIADPHTKQITLFVNAIEARHPKATEVAALAVLGQCIKALGDGVWDEDEHPRDEDGKFTFSGGDANDGGGVDFVSPSVADHMDFSQAVSALRGKQQAVLKEAGNYIDTALNLKTTAKDVIGAWSDGAENSVANFHGGTKWRDWDKLVVAASMKGHLADQKQVLVFQEAPLRKPRESVALKGSYPNMVGKIDVTVEVNPTRNEIRSLVNEYKMARILIDEDGNLYLWNADKAIHDQVAGALDLPGGTHKDVWFPYEGKVVSDRYLTGDTVEERFKTGVAEVRNKLNSLVGDSAALLSFEAEGSLEDIHKNLLADGLAFHSLVPHAGGATVYAAIVSKGDIKPTIAAAKRAAERYDNQVSVRLGRGEFIGDQLGTGSDREQRDRARSAYEGNIQRSDVQGSQAVWKSVRDRWGKALDEVKATARWLFRYTWNEEDHPRDEDGKFTFSGNDSNDGGDSGEGFGGGLVMPEDKPAGGGKSKEKVKLTDFEKDKIRLEGVGNKERADKFIEHWEKHVGESPKEFQDDFLGGVKARDVSISVRDDGTNWYVEGRVLDDSGDSIGTFQRTLDVKNKSAASEYLSISRTGRDIGKRILAGNIATYQKLGIEKVSVHANIDVGGYAWAKYGYVPTQNSWRDLRSSILSQLGDRSGRVTSTSTYTPESWDELSSDQQEEVKTQWMNDSRSEFYDSEVQNWRDNGEDLHIAKQELVRHFEDTVAQLWAIDAVGEWYDQQEKDGEKPPFTVNQILHSIKLTYDEDDYEGRKDPEIEFDDAKLSAIVQDPAQLELPYLGEGNPADVLTSGMRDDITKALVEAFNDKAEKDRGDVEPPNYLRDQIDETMEDYWSQYDDREKLRIAERLGISLDVEIENEEDPPEPVDVPEDENALLRQLANSSDPKSIWAIADSKRGKELLLNSDWYGVLNLKDKESMDRFNAYISKGKKSKRYEAA